MVISCGGVVVREDGKILVLVKKNGYHCLPKGRLEAGETWEETALREVKEETNIDAKIVEFIDDISYVIKDASGRRQRKIVNWFLMKPLTFDCKPQKSEGFRECDYLTRSEAQRFLTYANERYIVRKAFRIIRNNDEFYTDSES